MIYLNTVGYGDGKDKASVHVGRNGFSKEIKR